MDLNDVSEYFMLHLLGQRHKEMFCEKAGIYKISIVFNLLKVHFIKHQNNECWTRDISDSLKQKEGVYKKVEIGMYFLSQGRFVREVGKDKYLGKKWEITNKGKRVLDLYTAFLREEQKTTNYKIKESHKISREMKEID